MKVQKPESIKIASSLILLSVVYIYVAESCFYLEEIARNLESCHQNTTIFYVDIIQYLTAMHCDTGCSISTAQWGKKSVGNKESERKKQSGKTGTRIE
jgi:hypothetical protein